MFRPLLSFLCLFVVAGLDVAQSATQATQTKEIQAMEVLAEEETEPKDIASIGSTMRQAFHAQLHREFDYAQEINGAVALVFGAVLLYNGLAFFRWAVVFVIGVTVYFTSVNSLAVKFHDSDTPVHTTLWMQVVALELAVLVGFICGEEKNFEGIKKLVGIAVGLAAFGSIQFDLLQSDQDWEVNTGKNSIFLMVIGTLFIGFGFYLMAEGPSYFIAVLAPAFGGVLVSSGIWYWVAYVTTPAPHDVIYWIDFLDATDPRNPDVAPGMLKGDLNGVSLNQVCIIGTAFVIFAISACLQLRWAKRERKELGEKSQLWADIASLLLCVPVKGR